MKYPLEEIVWEDHFSFDGWTAKDDSTLEESVHVTSVGYRLKETKTKIVLVQSVSSADDVSNTLTILKKTIKSRATVREAQ